MNGRHRSIAIAEQTISKSRRSSKRQRREATTEEGAEPKEPKISYKDKKDEWVSFKKTTKNQKQLYEKMTQIIALPAGISTTRAKNGYASSPRQSGVSIIV